MTRGIYTAGYRSPGGHEILVGVDRQGRRVVEAMAPPHADRFEIVESVRDALNQIDPPLRVLR